MSVCRKLLAALLAAVSLPGLAAAAPLAERPNIVVVLLDNFGQEWLGCYGSETGRTPNIDRLAAEGVRAEHCYTPPVCGPSRIVLLTGRYPFRTGYTLHHDAGLYGGGGLDPVRDLIFPNVLHAAGYATGIFGKWQINDLYAEPDALARHGFDTHVVWPDALDVANLDDDEAGALGESDRRARRADDAGDAAAEREPLLGPGGAARRPARGADRPATAPTCFRTRPSISCERHRERAVPAVLPDGADARPVAQRAGRADAREPRREPPARSDLCRHGGLRRQAGRRAGRRARSARPAEEYDRRRRDRQRHRKPAGGPARTAATVHGGLYSLAEAGDRRRPAVQLPGAHSRRTNDSAGRFHRHFPDALRLRRRAAAAGPRLRRPLAGAVLRGDAGAKPPRDWIFYQYHTRRTVRDERFKLYSTGELYDADADRAETTNLAASDDAAVVAARTRLEKVLASLPPDSPPPFELRSQSAFKLRQAGELK